MNFIENERFIVAVQELKKAKVIKNDSDLAEILGVSRSTISDISNKKRGVSRAILNTMSHRLGVNEKYIKLGIPPILGFHEAISSIDQEEEINDYYDNIQPGDIINPHFDFSTDVDYTKLPKLHVAILAIQCAYRLEQQNRARDDIKYGQVTSSNDLTKDATILQNILSDIEKKIIRYEGILASLTMIAFGASMDDVDQITNSTILLSNNTVSHSDRDRLIDANLYLEEIRILQKGRIDILEKQIEDLQRENAELKALNKIENSKLPKK